MTTISTRRVALVTGGSRGLGRALAQRLAADGFDVAVASRSREQLERVVQEIASAGGRALALRCDVRKDEDVARTVTEVRRRFGPITLLVNNAGVAGPMGPVGTVDPAAWWDAQVVHLRGALLFMSAVVPDMASHGGGRIVNVCSQAGTFVAPNYSSYAVAKCSLIRLSEHVAAERRQQNIQVFPIQPGTIITDMARDALASPEARQWAQPLMALLEKLTSEDSDRAMNKLQNFVSQLARGHWDALSGQYLDVEQDLTALLRESADRGR